MQDSFTERLKRCMDRGGLTVADVARLFVRERRTVSDWVHKGRLPTGAREQEAYDCLTRLEQSIRKKQGFPVPLRLSKRNRVRYVQLVGEGKIADARVLAADTAA